MLHETVASPFPQVGRSILKDSIELKKRTQVSGVNLSASAYLVADYAQTSPHSTLVICKDEDTASEFYTDLLGYLKLMGNFFPHSRRPILFPGRETSPYSKAPPSLKLTLRRIATLSRFVSNTPPQPTFIVTTLGASYQKIMPLELFRAQSFCVEMRKRISSRQDITKRLIEGAYLQVDTVEDPGTFSVRGEILDIFLPHQVRPYRIELFDDEVERIREFDPSTQRTLGSEISGPIWVPPARDTLQIDQKNTACLWDYFQGDFPHTSVFIEEMTCVSKWEQFVEEQKKLYLEGIDRGRNISPFEDLYANPQLVAPTLCLEPLEITHHSGSDSIPPPNRYRIDLKENSDLGKRSRHQLGELELKFIDWLKNGQNILIVASTQSQLERIRFLLEGRSLPVQLQGSMIQSAIMLLQGNLSSGFRWESEKLIVITGEELLGTPARTRKIETRIETDPKKWSELAALSDLSVNDAIVHVDHGIGLYRGMTLLNIAGVPSEFLQIEYAQGDKLYLPIYRLNVIQKYVGSGSTHTLDRLGSQNFLRAKEKVKDAVKKVAIDLLQLYAERKIRPGMIFSGRDASFIEFESQFPFEETPDQLKAIDDVLSDMSSGHVMDRLICGDVGYGKTEIAIRAAYRAVSDGRQVAVLVPTTLLAKQHEISFQSRMKDSAVVIESVSRFRKPKEQRAVLEALTNGKVDIIIGTHRLLSKDVRFQDLGLIVVDEEHRFGVEHKEKLKTLRTNTHVLTLSATPIPRTLHMALSGLRDISLIHTPPIDRLPIRTTVSFYDEDLIRRAIETELQRQGQVFYLYNRVESIEKQAKLLRELAPQARIAVAHGQMPEKELEDTMMSFYDKQVDVLVCTTIIESGIDMPSANTLIVHRSDTLGLAQLYQIRGRVGRGQNRAYAYLLIPREGALTDDAKKRLEVIQRFVELGSGFHIASHDLEIRGGGDLLGANQSGHIASVGFDLYTDLLEEAVRKLQGKPLPPEDSLIEPEIKIPFSALLSEAYVPDTHQRLSLYRRFSAAKNDGEIDAFEEELRDRFGHLPSEAANLLWLIRIKILLKKNGILSLTAGPSKVSLLASPQSTLSPTQVIAMVAAHPNRYQLTPDSKLITSLSYSQPSELYFGVEKLLKSLS